MLGEFLTWWTEQMLQWVPARDPAAAHALILEPLPGWQEVDVILRRRRRDRPLGRFPLDGSGPPLPPPAARAPILLRLPPGLLLEREVTLPLAAEREPARVLAYEMDRITPFAAHEVVWTHAILRRDRARGRLHLRLSVVPRDALQPLLTALDAAGLAPALLELPDAAGTPRRIALLAPNSRRIRQLRRAACGLCAALAVAAIALPFVLQSRAGQRIEARIAALRPAVDEAEALRRRIAARTAGIDVIAAERQRLGDTLAVLAALTNLLPDDTYLTDLALRQGRLTLNGQSAAAARLIAALSADPAIRAPEFIAPVTRVNGAGGAAGHDDLFAIRAAVAP
jgi:general secretion pathway protein L